MAEELVLTFPRTLLDEIGSFQGLSTDVAPFIPRILDPRVTRYVPRSLAETDPSLKQIIPYVLVRRGDLYLHYVRGKASGEKRLVAMGSIGIGGHINHRDEDLFGSGLDFYESAVQRELHEELLIDADLSTRVVGVINDDSTPVGQVHFGVVHVCDLGDEHVSRGEPCITDLQFRSADDIRARRDQLESWSQFCADVLLAGGRRP